MAGGELKCNAKKNATVYSYNDSENNNNENRKKNANETQCCPNPFLFFFICFCCLCWFSPFVPRCGVFSAYSPHSSASSQFPFFADDQWLRRSSATEREREFKKEEARDDVILGCLPPAARQRRRCRCVASQKRLKKKRPT